MNTYLLGGQPVLGTPLRWCASGSFGTSSDGTCALCAVNHYSDTLLVGVGTCKLCDEDTTTSPQGSTSVTDCACRERYYRLNRSATVCDLCPPNADCAGQDAVPQAHPGFFPHPDHPFTVFVACPNADACTGGSNCSLGYEALRCTRCSSGYYREVNNRCEKCSGATGWWLLTLCTALVAAVALAVVVMITDAEKKKALVLPAVAALSYVLTRGVRPSTARTISTAAKLKQKDAEREAEEGSEKKGVPFLSLRSYVQFLQVVSALEKVRSFI